MKLGMVGAFVVALLALLIAACRPPPEKIAPLRLGYTPAEETVADREGAARALAAYLRARTGRDVQIVRTASYGPAVEALARGEVDLIGLGPFAYVLAAERGVAEALVTTAVDGRIRTYRSALIAHPRSGLGSLEDLARAAPRLTLNFTDPASNSGYLVPRARLLEQALDPERSFQRVTYTLSHSVSVLNVVHGRADVAGVNASTLERLLARGRVAPGELVTLWESPALPSGPVVVRKELPDSLKRELQAALVELPVADPAAWKLVEAQFADPGTRYVACDDGLYAGLRALWAAAVGPGEGPGSPAGAGPGRPAPAGVGSSTQ